MAYQPHGRLTVHPSKHEWEYGNPQPIEAYLPVIAKANRKGIQKFVIQHRPTGQYLKKWNGGRGYFELSNTPRMQPKSAINRSINMMLTWAGDSTEPEVIREHRFALVNDFIILEATVATATTKE